MEAKELRNGYTTGSCAAAAAKAAAMELLTGSCPCTISLILPGKEKAEFDVQKVNVENEASPLCYFRVRKDSGDDPDVTDKTYVYAVCRAISASDVEELKIHGKGYLMEGDPSIYIDGGPGIGLVTREGLSCPVGHYAINPIPRSQITAAVRDVCDETGYTGGLLVTIAVPEGAAIASKTFNPKLGITGGISILGTSGIVCPMSEDAVLQTIKLELHMRAVAGDKGVILVPGNYGETFLKEKLGIPKGTSVQISNFVRDSVLMACEEGFKKVLFAGHTGKLIKVAAGLPNTHSRYGDKRMETFKALLEKVSEGGSPVNNTGYNTKDHNLRNNGSSEETSKSDETDLKTIEECIISASTTDEALSILKKIYPSGQDTVKAFLNELADAVKKQMEEWSGKKLITEVIVFSREGDIGATSGVRDYFSL